MYSQNFANMNHHDDYVALQTNGYWGFVVGSKLISRLSTEVDNLCELYQIH